MKFGLKSIMFIIFIISILFSSIIYSSLYSVDKRDSVLAQMSLKDSLILENHDTIIINSDSAFGALGFPGDGSIGNPYIIENFRIVVDDYYSISISGTTKYVIIRSCYTESINSGIRIDDTVSSNTVLIENNECRNSVYGIKIRSSSSIIQNTCINNTYGISINNSPNSKVHNNECLENRVMGITISSSTNSEVKSNICSNNKREDGIHIDDSPNTRIEDNICMNNGYNGIWLRFSHSSNVSYNVLTNNGLTIYEDNMEDYLVHYYNEYFLNLISEKRSYHLQGKLIYGSKTLLIFTLTLH